MSNQQRLSDDKSFLSQRTLDHDTWNYGLARLPKASTILLGPIQGVLPFDGARNPGFRSATSHRVWLTYKTEANNWRPKVGICESAAEAGCALDLLIDPSTHDLKFQPLTIRFRSDDGKTPEYTHDLLHTAKNGHRRLIFVRNEVSLSKPKTWRDIKAIVAATPKNAADDMIVINASDYSRQRRENLFRMHQFVFEPDAEADEVVLWTARRHKTLRLMLDLFPRVTISQPRAFAACYRLVGRKLLQANLDHVLWEHSKISVAA